MSTSRGAMVMVFLSTLLAASGQILIKMGANNVEPELLQGIGSVSTLVDAAVILLPLGVGYGMYALAAVVLVVALKYGELSVLYPIYAMNFIWVAIASPHFFPSDFMNGLKWAGVASVFLGVTLIGFGSRDGGEGGG
ncbi:MAG: hypothetical protein GF416_00790 [Candidatus Altiarchaeales archaeon]|nr:hypothetical protein [Candidatus Altiarchaeales archaeon]MBD3415654.1 hypothetical protein [Candidatus Altiarchaeales archaeon]